ncbi:MAG: UDP-2,3-diacylglucosamine diphosphatase LpxI [Xanthobacteraceae bacterium]|nr:UDP-2,3-diacylglucosamine diphosphatase LpxI [Xanthobacteraceae bacterium]
MTDDTQPISSPVGLVAGGGVLPFAVADSLIARGVTPVLFALQGICDPQGVGRFRHHWVSIGHFGKLCRLLHAEGCRQLAFIGTLVRPALSEIRMDLGALRILPRLLPAFRGGDDHLLSNVGRLFEREGFAMVGIRDLAPDLLMPEGRLTHAAPDADADLDIVRGRGLLAALSPFDIGQAAVVIDGHVVAVEDIEGTDALLKRVARLRGEGRIRARGGRGVLVKAPKETQDLRFDLPTTGLRTVEGVATAGLAGMATVAGHTIAADLQGMIAAADRARVFIVGLPA